VSFAAFLNHCFSIPPEFLSNLVRAIASLFEEGQAFEAFSEEAREMTKAANPLHGRYFEHLANNRN